MNDNNTSKDVNTSKSSGSVFRDAMMLMFNEFKETIAQVVIKAQEAMRVEM